MTEYRKLRFLIEKKTIDLYSPDGRIVERIERKPGCVATQLMRFGDRILDGERRDEKPVNAG